MKYLIGALLCLMALNVAAQDISNRNVGIENLDWQVHFYVNETPGHTPNSATSLVYEMKKNTK